LSIRMSHRRHLLRDKALQGDEKVLLPSLANGSTRHDVCFASHIIHWAVISTGSANIFRILFSQSRVTVSADLRDRQR
jgi:hypothetical protein